MKEAQATAEGETGGRRKLLRSLAAGGSVAAFGATAPDVWVKPVVDSVVLPAHATTSVLGSYSGALAAPFVSTDDGSILDFFVTSAYAAECEGQTLANAGAPVCLQETLSGVLITFEGGSGAGSLEQLAGKGIAVTVGALVYVFSGSLTSGAISVSCGGGGGGQVMPNGGGNGGNGGNGGDNGGGENGGGGGRIVSSSYVTAPGSVCV